ncbi:hypothetical protein BT96DRAFT_987652 [Gymnopus androsaceus JB14]|uniref:Uncharacterized protein n=1 Tax=Gymnopus androsaceus JB14 TaxID=1447944 RepID=A0A6A4IA90_9AGAR|nr:hypothetical protein BT96DRAFT_987652 [Gymnopus androsaceus JB14]
MPSSSHHPFHMKSSRHSIELANADIFRLMDPSYHSSSSSEQAKAYIDRRGEMHDPDFHYFPVYPTGTGKSRRGRRVSDSMSRSQWRRMKTTNWRKKNRGHSSIIADSLRGDLAHRGRILCETTLSTPHPPPIRTALQHPIHHHHHHHHHHPHHRHHIPHLLPSSPLYVFGSTSSLHLSSYDDYTDPEDIDSEQGHDNGAEVVESSHHTESYSQTMKKQWLAVSLSYVEASRTFVSSTTALWRISVFAEGAFINRTDPNAIGWISKTDLKKFTTWAEFPRCHAYRGIQADANDHVQADEVGSSLSTEKIDYTVSVVHLYMNALTQHVLASPPYPFRFPWQVQKIDEAAAKMRNRT